MNKKVSLLIVSLVLTFIVFGISTYSQKKLINYIPTTKCMVVNKDIEAFTRLTKEDITFVDMPVNIMNSVRMVEDFSEIEELYLKDKIYKGQIVLANQFDTKENLMIYQAEIGKEKIAIKIKSAENGGAFTIRENSIVHVYATLPKEYANGVLEDMQKDSIGIEDDGYFIVKILDSVKILGTFNSDGAPLDESDEKIIDTILVAVMPEEARKINLIRDIATFNVTELGSVELEHLELEDTQKSESNVENVSGDLIIN